MEMIKVGIIGCGRVAYHHARVIQSHPYFELIAVCDVIIEKAEEMAKSFHCSEFTDYKEMLKKKELNIVVLCTPSGMHFEHAMDILTIKDINLIIEKPVCLKLDQIEELFKKCNSRNSHIFPIFQYRNNKAIQFAASYISSGKLGQIQIISAELLIARSDRYYAQSSWRGTYSMDGGVSVNQGIHFLDILHYLVGSVEDVYACHKTFGSNIEVEDTVVSVLKFKNGAVGTLNFTTAVRPEEIGSSLKIIGSKGHIEISGPGLNELTNVSELVSYSDHSESFKDEPYGFGHYMTYNQIYSALNDNLSYPVTKEDVLSSLGLLHAMYLSGQKDVSVKVGPILDFSPLGQYK
jgi:predicted dehydrogenase